MVMQLYRLCEWVLVIPRVGGCIGQYLGDGQICIDFGAGVELCR